MKRSIIHGVFCVFCLMVLHRGVSATDGYVSEPGDQCVIPDDQNAAAFICITERTKEIDWYLIIEGLDKTVNIVEDEHSVRPLEYGVKYYPEDYTSYLLVYNVTLQKSGLSYACKTPGFSMSSPGTLRVAELDQSDFKITTSIVNAKGNLLQQPNWVYRGETLNITVTSTPATPAPTLRLIVNLDPAAESIPGVNCTEPRGAALNYEVTVPVQGSADWLILIVTYSHPALIQTEEAFGSSTLLRVRGHGVFTEQPTDLCALPRGRAEFSCTTHAGEPIDWYRQEDGEKVWIYRDDKRQVPRMPWYQVKVTQSKEGQKRSRLIITHVKSDMHGVGFFCGVTNHMSTAVGRLDVAEFNQDTFTLDFLIRTGNETLESNGEEHVVPGQNYTVSVATSRTRPAPEVWLYVNEKLIVSTTGGIPVLPDTDKDKLKAGLRTTTASPGKGEVGGSSCKDPEGIAFERVLFVGPYSTVLNVTVMYTHVTLDGEHRIQSQVFVVDADVNSVSSSQSKALKVTSVIVVCAVVMGAMTCFLVRRARKKSKLYRQRMLMSRQYSEVSDRDKYKVVRGMKTSDLLGDDADL